MKPAFTIILALGLHPLYASPLDDINLLMRTKKMSVYGVKHEDKNATNGLGIFYNTQNLKVKTEGSNSSFKTGAIVQTNPFQNPMYVNVGGNYINEKIPENAFRSNTMNQYSGALAIGYNLNNDLYLEAGENISKLNGLQTTEELPVDSSMSKETYVQLGKRFKTPAGTVDAHLNSSQLYNTLATKEENYESNINYYLDDAVKVGYLYKINQNEISNGYSLDLGYFTTAYTKNLTQDSYNITLGVRANFTDITKLSTYKSTAKVKKRLSKSPKFDTIILQKNMHLRK